LQFVLQSEWEEFVGFSFLRDTLSPFAVTVADEMIDHAICIASDQVLEIVAELNARYSRLVFTNDLDQVLSGF